jgi:hypothetical protein
VRARQASMAASKAAWSPWARKASRAHGQVLIDLGDGEGDRPFGQAFGAGHDLTIASRAAATTPALKVCG